MVYVARVHIFFWNTSILSIGYWDSFNMCMRSKHALDALSFRERTNVFAAMQSHLVVFAFRLFIRDIKSVNFLVDFTWMTLWNGNFDSNSGHQVVLKWRHPTLTTSHMTVFASGKIATCRDGKILRPCSLINNGVLKWVHNVISELL